MSITTTVAGTAGARGFLLAHRPVLLASLLMMGLLPAWSQAAAPTDTTIGNRMTLEQIKKAVNTALPQGATLPEIEKYFTDNKVEHGYYKSTNRILAMVHNVRGGFFPVSKDAQIIVTLDEHDRLDSLEVKPVFTGP